jgi:hypothetical protein
VLKGLYTEQRRRFLQSEFRKYRQCTFIEQIWKNRADYEEVMMMMLQKKVGFNVPDVARSDYLRDVHSTGRINQWQISDAMQSIINFGFHYRLLD